MKESTKVLAKIYEEVGDAVLVLENRVLVDASFLRAGPQGRESDVVDRLRHLRVVHAATQLGEGVPNVAYRFYAYADETKSGGDCKGRAPEAVVYKRGGFQGGNKGDVVLTRLSREALPGDLSRVCKVPTLSEHSHSYRVGQLDSEIISRRGLSKGGSILFSCDEVRSLHSNVERVISKPPCPTQAASRRAACSCRTRRCRPRGRSWSSRGASRLAPGRTRPRNGGATRPRGRSNSGGRARTRSCGEARAARESAGRIACAVRSASRTFSASRFCVELNWFDDTSI